MRVANNGATIAPHEYDAGNADSGMTDGLIKYQDSEPIGAELRYLQYLGTLPTLWLVHHLLKY